MVTVSVVFGRTQAQAKFYVGGQQIGLRAAFGLHQKKARFVALGKNIAMQKKVKDRKKKKAKEAKKKAKKAKKKEVKRAKNNLSGRVINVLTRRGDTVVHADFCWDTLVVSNAIPRGFERVTIGRPLTAQGNCSMSYFSKDKKFFIKTALLYSLEGEAIEKEVDIYFHDKGMRTCKAGGQAVGVALALPPGVAEFESKEAFGEYQANNSDVYICLVMKSMQAPLGSLLRAGKPMNAPLHSTKGYALSILAELECMHQNGLLHSDLKPDNIMIDNDEAHIIDFGIAEKMKSVSLRAGSKLDRYNRPEWYKFRGIKGGTMEYMSLLGTAGGFESYADEVETLVFMLYDMLFGTGTRKPVPPQTISALIEHNRLRNLPQYRLWSRVQSAPTEYKKRLAWNRGVKPTRPEWTLSPEDPLDTYWTEWVQSTRADVKTLQLIKDLEEYAESNKRKLHVKDSMSKVERDAIRSLQGGIEKLRAVPFGKLPDYKGLEEIIKSLNISKAN